MMNISVICPSEIAIRRFMPALSQIQEMHFVGVGICSEIEYGLNNSQYYEDFKNSQKNKAEAFTKSYGGRIFKSYEEAVTADEIDAVYLPLPPAFHYRWARKALENGKHILVEKPATISLHNTSDLIRIADEKSLAVQENYMFIYHSQLDDIENIIESGEIGEVRLYRISFGFPRRAMNDFRYDANAGGGALFDAGGYTMKYARRLLGGTAKVVQATMNHIEEYDVDIFGSAVMTNDQGLTAQLAFGMDNDYKCELEVWGSKGTLYTNRVLTAPVGYNPTVRISKNGNIEEMTLSADDTFMKSIYKFLDCISDEKIRKRNYEEILKQADYVDTFMKLSRIN